MVFLPVRRAGVAFLFVIAPLVATAQQPTPALRVWTAVNGQKFQTKFIGLEGVNAIFQLIAGQTAKVDGDAVDTFPGDPRRPAAKNTEEFGIEKLSILFDSRDAATLDADIRNGFKKIGIKL